MDETFAEHPASLGEDLGDRLEGFAGEDDPEAHAPFGDLGERREERRRVLVVLPTVVPHHDRGVMRLSWEGEPIELYPHRKDAGGILDAVEVVEVAMVGEAAQELGEVGEQLATVVLGVEDHAIRAARLSQFVMA